MDGWNIHLSLFYILKGKERGRLEWQLSPYTISNFHHLYKFSSKPNYPFLLVQCPPWIPQNSNLSFAWNPLKLWRKSYQLQTLQLIRSHEDAMYFWCVFPQSEINPFRRMNEVTIEWTHHEFVFFARYFQCGTNNQMHYFRCKNEVPKCLHASCRKVEWLQQSKVFAAHSEQPN